MKKVSLIFIFAMAIAAFANAQATRTWVSGVGDDVNPCSRTAPCKTFAGTISKTASPGIINCLDPGGFGAVTITKSITIDCTGVTGGPLASGVQGIIINTGLTTDKVVLRGFDINGAGVTLGTNGVNILQAGSVTLFNVSIANFSNTGIETTNSANQVMVSVDHCQITNAGTGILAASTGSGTTLLSVSNSYIGNNSKGIDVEAASSSAQVSNTVLTRNTSDGFKVGPGTSGGALESDSISFNGNGVNVATAGGTVRLSRNTIHANFTNGITGAGATQCFSNNTITGNIGNNNCSSPNQGQQ